MAAFSVAGELLLSRRAGGHRGALRPCLSVKGVQKFLSGFRERWLVELGYEQLAC